MDYKQLYEAALAVAKNAYVPYSQFHVGAEVTELQTVQNEQLFFQPLKKDIKLLKQSQLLPQMQITQLHLVEFAAKF